jgi:Nitrous oxide-stimulated promoter
MQSQPPNPEHKRMKREKQTIGYMVEIYCKNHHGAHSEICPECRQFQEYAFMRLDKCPFQEKKSTCGNCLIHCYRPDMKDKVKVVMRYSGPRMLLHHPSLALHHVWDARRKPPTLSKKEN